ncbi:hypothetical protein MtrunA17_Chr7g0231091 [Medicago truncatula]|uniref:Uncharacterized protein n=1 Tax=Medicago truncatula TaxID=3880 RepID=A0A396GWC6_MEDTR|nr:hypothetical protein MtrunA17_Chr7g0231091 [Medicago truncatula]
MLENTTDAETLAFTLSQPPKSIYRSCVQFSTTCFTPFSMTSSQFSSNSCNSPQQFFEII